MICLLLGSTVKFNVTYSNTYKLVHNLVLDEYYVLYCTSSAPSLGATFQSKTYIQIPVKSFAAIDTRALGYLDVSARNTYNGPLIQYLLYSFLDKVITLSTLETQQMSPHHVAQTHPLILMSVMQA